MRIFTIIVLSLFVFSSTANASLSLTNEQYANIGLVDREIRRQDSLFLGFAGKKNKMEVIGSVSEAQVQIYLDAMDIPALILADPAYQKELRIIGDLRLNAKLSDETIEFLTGFDLS